MSKKMSKAILAVMVVSMLVTGCSSNKAVSNEVGQGDKQVGNIAEQLNLEGLPIVEKQVTLKVAATRGSNMVVPYSDMPVLKEFEEKTNVKIQWEEIDSSAKAEKINLMFSSNTLPDVFYGGMLTDEQLVKFAQTGAIMPLNDLIDKYAPNLKAFMDSRPDYVQNITLPDGNIYSLAGLIEEERNISTQNMFINKKWLDNLGLEVPTTSDELYEVLKAFKTKDPNGNGKADEIPFSVTEKFYSIHTMFGMFGLPDRTSHLSVKDGKVIYTAIEPEYKEGIKYFNKLYTEGLLDSEMFVQDLSKLKAKGHNADNILGMTILFWPDDAIPRDRQDEYIHLQPLKGPNGDQLVARNTVAPGLGRNAFTITSKCENPELAIRWADEWCKEINALQALNGTQDEAWGYLDKGKWETYNNRELPEGMTYDQYRHTQSPGASSFYFIPKDLADKRVLDPMNQAQHERYLAYMPYVEPAENILPPLYLSPEDQNEISALSQDIKNYVEQKRAKWITEDGIDKEWDEYIGAVEKLNVNRLLEIYQNALDALK